MGLTFTSLNNFQKHPSGTFEIFPRVLFFNFENTNEERIHFHLGKVQYLCYIVGSL